jgi:hypothetical protein
MIVKRPMEPLISIVLADQKRVYSPGERLVCEYQVDAVSAREIQAVEASVLWYTEGKGDEDFAVHWFKRRLPADVENRDLRPLQRIDVLLPYTPLSYAGEILKIHWCVRIRVFLRGGKEFCLDQPFQLGKLASAAAGVS